MEEQNLNLATKSDDLVAATDMLLELGNRNDPDEDVSDEIFQGKISSPCPM